MADYPTSKKNFTALIDGTTFMEAVNVNVVYDEVEATQLFIGASGAAQSHNSNILELLLNKYVGLRVEYSDTDEINIKSGQAIIPNVTASIKKLRGNSGDIPIDINDLDTGAMAEGYYYIYAVADASGSAIAFVFSASGSAPTGYTYYKKIGWFYNETASVFDVTTKQLGNMKDGSDNPNFIVLENASLNQNISGTTWQDITSFTGIKFVSNGRPIKIKGGFLVKHDDGSGGRNIQVQVEIDTTDKGASICSNFTDGSSANRYSDSGLVFSYNINDLSAGEHTFDFEMRSIRADNSNLYTAWISIEEV